MANTRSLVAVVAGSLVTTCQIAAQVAEEGGWQPIEVPHQRAAMAPEITATPHGTALTWLEATSEDRRPTYALMAAPYRDGGFAQPMAVAEDRRMFANWADFPSALCAEDGRILAHWLRRGGRGQYGVVLAEREPDGEAFVELGHPHSGGIQGEHGFVSMLPEGDSIRLFWLDGRNFETQRLMELRTALVKGGKVEAEEVLDPDVCTCCQTSATMADSGPVVVYRGRDQGEIRDIKIVCQRDGRWTAPVTIADDGWVMPGCPVNGPAIAANGEQLAVAWYTAAKSGAGVKVAFSADGGQTFAPPQWVDRNEPLGRVDITRDGSGFAITWLGKVADQAVVCVQDWTPEKPPGTVFKVDEVAPTRTTGFPRLTTTPEGTLLVWKAGDDLRAALRKTSR